MDRGFSGFTDRAFDMTAEAALQNIPHTASTLTVSWFASGAGWQGGSDESWAIDNLSVSINAAPAATPEPGTLALLVTSGLTGTGLFLRRRRRK